MVLGVKMIKKCTKCKEEKEINNFYNIKSSWCKKCQSRQIMEKRRERPNIYERYIKDTWTQPNMIFARKKANAKKDGVLFTIKKEEFIEWYEKQPLECHYCGLKPENFKNLGDNLLSKKTNLDIDRIDSSKGYEVGNLVLSCGRCNMVKGGFFTYLEMVSIGKKFVKPKWRKILRNKNKLTKFEEDKGKQLRKIQSPLDTL